MTEIEDVKKKYQQNLNHLNEERAEAQRRTQEAEELKKSLKEDTKKQAQSMVKDKLKSLDKSFKLKVSGFYSYMTGVSLYAILVTILTAIRSEAFVSDFKGFFLAMWRFIQVCVEQLQNGANIVSELGNKIPQPTVANIVHWILWVLVVVGVSCGAFVLLIKGSAKLIKWYKKEYADSVSLGVFLVSLAVTVFFAQELKNILPFNILLILIFTHVLYMGARWYLEGYYDSRGY